MNIEKKKKLNILPLFGDFSLLIIGLFILSLLMAISTLQESELPESIPTDEYFISGVDTLTQAGVQKMDLFIRDSIFHKIKKILDIDPDNLINIRVVGHTDADTPKIKMKERRWKTNRELSQFRANQIADIIENVAKDSLSTNEFEALNKKIISAGFGERYPQADTITHKDGWLVVNTISGDSLDGPFSDKGVAIRKAYKLNRRVEVSIIKRGY